MKTVEFNLNYIPSPKGRPRMTKKGFSYTPDKTRKVEDDLRVLIQSKLDSGFEPFEGAIKLYLKVFLPRPKSHFRTGKYSGEKKPNAPHFHSKRPDLDNLEKLFMDAANGILYKDDAQIGIKESQKVYVEDHAPGYYVKIEGLE